MARTNGSWRPGTSGNPGGRPKVLAAVQALARRHTVAAIGELFRIMQNGESDHVKLAAAKLLLERGWGQPCLPITGADGESGIVVQVLTLTDPSEAEAPAAEPQRRPAGSAQFVDFNEVSDRDVRGGPNIHIAGARGR